MKKIIIILGLITAVISTVAIASDLVIESKTQTFNEKDNKIIFKDDVKVHLDDLHIVGDKADVSVTKNNKLDTATFYDKPYAVQIQSNKKREVKANILKLSLINKVIKAEGEAQSTITEGNKPIAIITSDIQEYDTKTNVMTATGGVVIKYNDVETFSDKAVIRTSSKGDIEKLDLYGHAKVQEKVNNAQADHFSYDAVKDEIYSEGNTMSHTELEGGIPLIVRGRYQQYSKKQNIFNASGNVRVWYDDYYAKGPKMTVYPDKITNKFNEIYFTGRSFINQGARTIYADKIKMILKPKDFFAEGNTRTIIRNVQAEENEGKLK